MLDRKILKAAVSKIQSMNYGDTITHAELADEFGLPPKTSAYYTAVSKLQEECLESGKMLENIIKVGYRIIYPDDYSNFAIKQYRQGARRLSRGEKILKYAPTENMTQEGLAVYRNVKDRALMLNAHLAGAVVELKILQKKHPLLTTNFK